MRKQEIKREKKRKIENSPKLIDFCKKIFKKVLTPQKSNDIIVEQ